MEKLQTFEEYQNLVNSIRLAHKKIFSNNYFMAEDVQRYIRLGRAYYEKTDSGLIFLFDEECFYRACLYVDVSQSFTIPVLDKRIVIRNIYRAGKKETEMCAVEKELERLNFRKTGVTVQLRGDVQEIVEKTKKHERFVQSMEKKGYRCVIAERSHFKQIEDLLIGSEIIKDYHIDYLTPEEKKKGDYLYIVNAAGEMCAASISVVKNGLASGIGVAVLDKYKLQGLPPILGYHRMKWLNENNVKRIQAWALIDNENSIRYHTSLGYKVTNRHADEWVREVVN